MDFFNYIRNQNISTYDALIEHLKSDEIKIRVKEDKKYPDFFVLCHDDNTVKTSPIYHCTNGMILRKVDCVPVCYSFNKMEDNEISDEEKAQGIKFKIDSQFDFSNARLEYALEGTLVRVWKYTDNTTGETNLMISTKRCIDAIRSKWISDKSFKELFMESMNGINLHDIIQENYAYSFLLTHPENNMVVQYDKPISYHIGTRNMSSMMEEDVVLEGVQRVPIQVIDASNVSQYVSYIFNNEIYNIEGYVIVDKNFRRQKFIAPSYQKAKDIYGNSNSKMYKFFNLRKNVQDLNEYLKLFPKDVPEFNSYEYNFYQIATQVHKLYVNKFVKRPKDENGNQLMIPVPFYLKKLVYGLHSDYKTHKVQTNLEKVFHKLADLDVNLQCFIYNHMINNGSTPITYEAIFSNAFPIVKEEGQSSMNVEEEQAQEIEMSVDA
jgi:hypothetical protein